MSNVGEAGDNYHYVNSLENDTVCSLTQIMTLVISVRALGFSDCHDHRIYNLGAQGLMSEDWEHRLYQAKPHSHCKQTLSTGSTTHVSSLSAFTAIVAMTGNPKSQSALRRAAINSLM